MLYIGDVPIERSYHGSLVLYRLLEDYPVDSLIVVETGKESNSMQRFSDVKYLSLPMRSSWLDTRFHSIVLSWSMFRAERPEMLKRLVSLRFDAVITVVHGLGWLLAAAVAREAKVPLHLIVHDDWPRVANVPALFRSWLDRRFAQVYRQASSRMCVSPFMRANYLERYGRDAEVLYPARAKECPHFEAVPARLRRDDAPLTIAFAGTVNSEGYSHALQTLAESLAKLDGRLLIFGPLQQKEAERIGLHAPHIMLGGLLAPSDLILRLRNEADVLFVPMSFSESERSNMTMAFPSKLADYTATGLPLLIYGPHYSSAVRWANENPGVAEVVVAEDEALIVRALRRLSNAQTRLTLGQNALEVGGQYFCHDAALRTFQTALSQRFQVRDH